MSDVLVDSSVWIPFFRGDKKTTIRLDRLIADDRVAVSGPIVAEVASGAPTRAVYAKVREHLLALTVLADPGDLWDRVADARFALARQGVQAHLVDLAIAVTSHAFAHTLLTRDGDFRRIARVIPFDLEVY